jgi:hypothetical protein
MGKGGLAGSAWAKSAVPLLQGYRRRNLVGLVGVGFGRFFVVVLVSFDAKNFGCDGVFL